MKPGRCIDYSGIVIKGEKVSGLCPKGLYTRAAMSIFDFVPENFCPLAFHTIYPYLLAFTHNANFGWLQDRASVEAQCPNPDCAVVMRLKKRAKKQKIFDIEVIGFKAACPYGMNKGKAFSDVRLPQGACLRAFDAIMPYINELAGPIEPGKEQRCAALTATCPGCSYSVKDQGFSSVIFTMKGDGI
ncbi:MAG: TIGR04076 family protein [Candidatus Omnitrophica bacterium]|nr:TIGR04076 family protein [Candidatus Omnitrophota bacterium]